MILGRKVPLIIRLTKGKGCANLGRRKPKILVEQPCWDMVPI